MALIPPIPIRFHITSRIIAPIGVLLAAVLGALLRLADPLTTPVIPAEDPYTHMALVREHIRDGNLDPLNPPGGLYPPGMHLLVAAWWVHTGLDLYDLFLFGPVVLGVLGIIGMGVLLARSAGPVAAVVGALAYAVIPEVILRTTMMSPTALDLALLPFLLLVWLEVARGRLAWLGLMVPMLFFLVLSHPWVLVILCMALFVLAVIQLAFPWRSEESHSFSPRGLLAIGGFTGAALAFAASGCAGGCGPGFAGLFTQPGPAWAHALALMIFLSALIPAGLLLFVPDAVDRVVLRFCAKRRSAWMKALASILLAIGLVTMTRVALQGGFPDQVDPRRMFGWPLLAMGTLVVVALPWISRPAIVLGAAVALSTYPFMIFNPLDSPFWPHRTAVYFGLGLTILAGAGAQWLAGAVQAWPNRLAIRATQTNPGISRTRWAGVALVAPLLVGGVVGATVYAGTPDGYEGGWYRLYHPCELEALQLIANEIGEEPDLLIVSGSWQAKLVLAGLSSDATRVWFKPDLIANEWEREKFLADQHRQQKHLLLVLDQHFRYEYSHLDTGFLDEHPWQQTGSYCAGMGISHSRITTYVPGGLP